MPQLLERSLRSVEDRMILLAPPRRAVPSVFGNIDPSTERHRQRLEEMQRLRGSIYWEDGALTSRDLTADGLHCTPEDEQSWHLLMTNTAGDVTACVRYMEHTDVPPMARLRVGHSPAAMRQESKQVFWRAVKSDLERARRERLRFAEIGGWAVSKESRGTADGLLLAFAAFSFGRMFGGALGITTATVRHSSASILQRIGGTPLEADGATVEPYFDPQYQCWMEVLRFDSRQPSPRYAAVIDMLEEKLMSAHVIERKADVAELQQRVPARVASIRERRRRHRAA